MDAKTENLQQPPRNVSGALCQGRASSGSTSIPARPDCAVCVCDLDGKLPSPNAITRRWYAFRRQMGYDDVRIHDLRHSAAMMMIHSGADLNTVKNILGHTKSETTQRVLHEDFDTAAAASKRVIEGIFPTLPKDDATAEN